MKNILTTTVYYILVLLLFTSCIHKNNKSINIEDESNKKIKVYTSFYPMYDFAKKIGGDKIELKNLLSNGEEVHQWEPLPSDIVDLENGDVFIYSGVSMEHWVSEVLPTLKTEHLIVLEASKNIKLLDAVDEHDEENVTGDVSEDEHGEYDPHVWLSINNAKIQLENIKNVLIEADPSNKDFYEENYKKYEKQFTDLDTEFKSQLKDFKGKTIVVSHESFGYLCHDYDLHQVGIQSIIPDSEPEPARISEVIKIVKENNVHVIFYEELQGSKVSEIIAKETGAKIGILNTLESLSQKDQEDGKEYISVMKENLKNIISGFVK